MQFLDSVVIDTTGVVNHASIGIDVTGASSSFTLIWNGPSQLIADKVIITTDLTVETMLEHGWQSWSTVRPTTPGDIRPERAAAPRWFRNQMCANGRIAGTRVVADTVLVHTDGLLGASDPSGHPVSFACDPQTGAVAIEILLDGSRIEAGGNLDLGGIVALTGAPGPALSTWATMTGNSLGARVSAPAPLGWCSWYHYFNSVTDDVVLGNLALASRHGLEVIQIDDGWQRSIGEWTTTSASFGRPIESLAGAISQQGLTAGIWTAPFIAIEGGPLAESHPEWLVRREDGQARTALFNPEWGGRVFALDLSRPDVLEHIESEFRWLHDVGFEYFKIDFLHAGAVPGRRHGDGTITRVDALKDGLRAIRRAIGPHAFLLGCGAPLGPTIGLLDAMRVSEDVAPFWDPRLSFPGWPESTVAAANSVEQTLRRSPLHRRWFVNDPDCALLRPNDTELSGVERHTVADTVIGTGGFTMVSDDLALYRSLEWAAVEEMGANRRRIDGPLELSDPLALSRLVVQGQHHRLEVDLASKSSSLTFAPRSA